MRGVMLEVGSQSKDAVHFVHSQMTNLFFVPSLFFDRAPARQTTRIFFFPVVITIAHPPDRRLELFFPVVITIVHPPDRRLELFLSGRNNDSASARQTTRTFFSGSSSPRKAWAGSSSPREVSVFVSLSVHLSVRAKRGI